MLHDSNEERQTMNAKSILVVDDSRSLRQMVSYILNAAGYQVGEAVDGMDGWEKAQSHLFDLVFTDQNMPQYDGMWLIRALRNSEDYRTTPILMLTTESSDEMKAMGRQAGATGWIIKPFDPEKMINLIKKLIGEPG